MEKAGFTNVKQVVKPIPIGTWAKDKNLKDAGALLQHALLLDLRGLFNYPAWLLEWGRQEVDVFLVGVREALQSPSANLYIEAAVIVGQKPGPG
ncbi:hypothetical protein QQX98_010141 [Neonectria punicea]|uniref:Uncharacterized protein n=1 Tax=Neonectria punicea TaxID=979145 RepID=A0ABR1GQI3_9HYPO